MSASSGTGAESALNRNGDYGNMWKDERGDTYGAKIATSCTLKTISAYGSAIYPSAP